ncbi:MAG TPA: peroxiredoxin-like family protein [Methylomirabilota bacterium]|nr:peroxiredoxin-like family protein [Methylomirabilota bacterium]
MTEAERRPPLGPGEPAPDFTLPLVNREGTVSLRDYRGRNPVLLAIFRGLHCAFCRRHLAQLGSTRDKLREAGIEVLAITASPLERARLYTRFRPLRVPLAADPELVTHRLYGLPRHAPTPEFHLWIQSKYHELARELGRPLPDNAPYTDLVETVGRLEDFEMTEADWKDRRRGEGLIGQFLVDPDGIVRWANIEGATEATGLAGFPSADQLLAAARRI